MKSKWLAFLLFLSVSVLHGQAPDSLDNYAWKFSPYAKRVQHRNEVHAEKFILSGIKFSQLYTTIKNLGPQVEIIAIDIPSHSVVISTKKAFLVQKILPLKEVVFIDRVVEPTTDAKIIGYNRSFHGINAVDYDLPGANGKNIVAGIKEHKMEEQDLDVWKRVMPSSLASTSITNHATIIASIVGGAGNSFYDGRGIAWGAKFFPSNFSNLFPDNEAVLNANKVTVQNHSYGTLIQQFYGAEAVSYDAQTWSNKNILHIFSSGNRGTEAASEGKYVNLANFANLTGNFKMAKNIVTVGAIDNKGNIADESSSGPLYDGRIAPQLTALGPNGTSDAAAIVSGTVAVMQQVYADSNNQASAPASLIKALLYNNAEDIGRIGIDYKTGYGLLDSYKSIRYLMQKKYDAGTIALSQSWTKIITVPQNIAEFKVTLAWTDSTAQVNNDKALVNDLDIQVVDVNSGIIHLPWVLSSFPHIDSLIKLPARKRDSLNTAEQVSIQKPAAGNYQLKVTATSVTGTIPFHVSISMDTLNTFHFTSPQHSSDINAGENQELRIRWKTFVADTNQTGNLLISYDRKASWVLISSGLKIYKNHFLWNTKDTSSTAVFKMETSFGNFYSKEFVISPVIRPVVDFYCADSIGISWNKHIYANAYRVFTLTDSPYLKPVRVVTDSFTVFRRADFPSSVYAVEPILTNNIPATRSIAFDAAFQGVNCFYKVLNADVQDDNIIQLKLELSSPYNVDSIFFEITSSTGQLLQAIGNAKAISSIYLYTQLVNNPRSGLTYFRARIKLKSGIVVYTDMITVLTTGEKKIVFYPNPAMQNSVLKYVLRQGISTGSRLQFFDTYGRLVKDYITLPGDINASILPKGLLLFRLFDDKGVLLETGRLVIL